MFFHAFCLLLKKTPFLSLKMVFNHSLLSFFITFLTGKRLHKNRSFFTLLMERVVLSIARIAVLMILIDSPGKFSIPGTLFYTMPL